MFKRKKDEPTVEAPAPVAPPAPEWAETFDTADHKDFIKMSAEAMQAAMNQAARDGDVEKMLKVAGHWGTLASTMRDLQRSRTPIGFNKEDDDD
jgi:hypothetical protein